MGEAQPDCVICRGRAGDAELRRVEVWDDDRWRLTVSLFAEVPGFAYLEPKRHIPHIADLGGDEARTFGGVLARAARALRDVTRAEQVYVYVFGEGVPHLHVHLAPHRPNDALNSQMVRGELETREMADGTSVIVSRDFPPLAEEDLRAVAARVRERLRRDDRAPADGSHALRDVP